MRSTLEGASILALAVSSWLVSACQPPKPVHPTAFDRRASFDLNCPWQEIDFVPLKERNPRTYGVRGCGKRATYLEDCQRGFNTDRFADESCAWILDGPILADAPTAPPPVAPPTTPAPAASVQ